MKKGMKIKFRVSPRHAFGEEGIPGYISPNTSVIYLVELLDHEISAEN